MNKELREAVARALYERWKKLSDDGTFPDWEQLDHSIREGYRADADAAISIIRPAVLEEAAKAAEGPSYRTNPNTGEASIRGTDDGNWSVPQPISGFKGSDYGTGRYAAAAAIRALAKEGE